MNKFLEDESLVINNESDSQEVDKEELEERRQEMLKDNRLEKYNAYKKKASPAINDDDL